MADVVDSKTRSRMMSGIRGKNTKPEILIRSLLHRNGYRFRIHQNNLPGQPDITLKKYQAVIFVHGCFWHRHLCHLFKWPKTRPDFWREKINKNFLNDQKVIKKLISSGWRICIVWECSLKGVHKNLTATICKLEKWLNSEEQFMEIEG
jgi:DNA mismatch endonuclease (patch repair protein)